MASCDARVLNRRTASDMSEDLASAVKRVTVHMETLPVGTFKYKVFKYPGDVDIFEEIIGCCTFNQAKLSIAGTVRDVVKKVMKDKDMIFSEFKAGYDYRYKIYTGVFNGKIEDYNPQLVRRDIRNLYAAGLFSANAYQYLTSLAKDRPSKEELIQLNEELRKFWVMRWSAPEVIQAYKVLPGNYRLFLDIALTQGSIVKLDAITKIDGRYVEVTNFFLIKQKDKYGREIVLSEELEDYKQSILADFYKYKEKKTLKAVKRLWMYLAFENRICDLNLFTPLFSSEIAEQAQIMADLEVATYLLQSNLPYDPKFLYDSMIKRLSLLKGKCGTERVLTQTYPSLSLSFLQQVEKCLAEEVNKATQQWLTERKINLEALVQKSA